MFTIYINSFDVRRIIKTLELQKASHKGELFKVQAETDIDGPMIFFECIGATDFFCRLTARNEKYGNVIDWTHISLDDLESLLKKFEITAKVDSFIVKIEISDIVEFGETCPNCDHETCGVTDSSLIATCEECGEELMICSFCPTHCYEKDDEVCESCMFSGMDCSFPCNCNSGEGCHMKLRAKNIKTF